MQNIQTSRSEQTVYTQHLHCLPFYQYFKTYQRVVRLGKILYGANKVQVYLVLMVKFYIEKFKKKKNYIYKKTKLKYMYMYVYISLPMFVQHVTLNRHIFFFYLAY